MWTGPASGPPCTPFPHLSGSHTIYPSTNNTKFSRGTWTSTTNVRETSKLPGNTPWWGESVHHCRTIVTKGQTALLMAPKGCICIWISSSRGESTTQEGGRQYSQCSPHQKAHRSQTRTMKQVYSSILMCKRLILRHSTS